MSRADIEAFLNSSQTGDETLVDAELAAGHHRARFPNPPIDALGAYVASQRLGVLPFAAALIARVGRLRAIPVENAASGLHHADTQALTLTLLGVPPDAPAARAAARILAQSEGEFASVLGEAANAGADAEALAEFRKSFVDDPRAERRAFWGARR